MKKLFIILFDLLIIALLLLALGFSSNRENEVLCAEVRINMIDTLNSGFLKKTDIEKVLLAEGNEILGYPIRNINTRDLESKLMTMPYIKSAEIYSSMNGVMRVDIVQRKPVVRIFTRSNNTYYLDRQGYIFPSGKGFTPHVLIANGYFTESKEIKNSKNLWELEDYEKFSEWFDALELANFINKDDFWRSNIVQAYYNSRGDFELIPRVGAHQIIFGEIEDKEKKFEKLMTLYEEGLEYEGWNSYEKINLKYKNQVICTKR